MASHPPNDNLLNNIFNRLINISNTYIQHNEASSEPNISSAIINHNIGAVEPHIATATANIINFNEFSNFLNSNISLNYDSDSDVSDMPDLTIDIDNPLEDDNGDHEESFINNIEYSNIMETHNNIVYMSPISVPINGTYSRQRYSTIISNYIIPIDGGGADAASGGSTIRSVIEQSFENDKNKYKHVLSDDASSEYLKPVLFSTIETDNTECAIMKELFEKDDMVIQLPCKHVFNTDAIKHWLENESATCPVCRFKLPSKEIKNNDEERPPPSSENRQEPSSYYRSLLRQINIIRNTREEQDVQQAIFNSLN